MRTIICSLALWLGCIACTGRAGGMDVAENLVEVDTYSPVVTVPEPGDDRTTGSVRGAFQALANRAKYLYTRAGDAIRVMPGVEVLYANASRVAERRLRHDYLPLTELSMRAETFYMSDYGYVAVAHAAGASNPVVECSAHLRLPNGSRLESVSAVMYGTPDVTWSLRVRPIVFSPFDAPTPGAELVDAISVGGSATVVSPMVIIPGGQEINADTSRVAVTLRANKTGPAALNLLGYIYALHIQWLDPGPRSGN